MGSVTRPALLALLGLFCLGASCDTSNGDTANADTAKAPAGPRIEKLERVDISELTASESKLWADLINERLSPCGEPISVGQCVSESRACNRCVPAARYLVRLVAEGFERSEIEEMYVARYDDKKVVKLATDKAPMKGAPMAPITLVEFSDFECPYCGAAHPQLKRILKENEGKVKLVFKHYPLSGHVNAMPAALAAVAAQQQGKFWEMADLLFENQRDLNPEKIRELAVKAGLDMARFDADVKSEAIQQKVDADKAEGEKAGVQGTPSLYINGRRYLEPVNALTKYLREELQ